MKNFFNYILSFLVLVITIGQKDINLLIQDITEKKYVIKYNSENEEGEEDSESEKDTKERELEEEIEGKRKKSNNYISFSPHSSTTFSFKSLNVLAIYEGAKKSIFHLNLNKLPSYLKNCSLIFYEHIS